MEYKEVIGIRRSIRYFDPDRPVEREKIQKILEAMRIASCAVNAHWLRAIVVQRSEIPEATLESLKTPVTALVQELAPVHIYCYLDTGIVKRVEGKRLRELVDVGCAQPEPRLESQVRGRDGLSPDPRALLRGSRVPGRGGIRLRGRRYAGPARGRGRRSRRLLDGLQCRARQGDDGHPG